MDNNSVKADQSHVNNNNNVLNTAMHKQSGLFAPAERKPAEIPCDKSLSIPDGEAIIESHITWQQDLHKYNININQLIGNGINTHKKGQYAAKRTHLEGKLDVIKTVNSGNGILKGEISQGIAKGVEKQVTDDNSNNIIEENQCLDNSLDSRASSDIIFDGGINLLEKGTIHYNGPNSEQLEELTLPSVNTTVCMVKNIENLPNFHEGDAEKCANDYCCNNNIEEFDMENGCDTSGSNCLGNYTRMDLSGGHYYGRESYNSSEVDSGHLGRKGLSSTSSSLIIKSTSNSCHDEFHNTVNGNSIKSCASFYNPANDLIANYCSSDGKAINCDSDRGDVLLPVLKTVAGNNRSGFNGTIDNDAASYTRILGDNSKKGICEVGIQVVGDLEEDKLTATLKNVDDCGTNNKALEQAEKYRGNCRKYQHVNCNQGCSNNCDVNTRKEDEIEDREKAICKSKDKEGGLISVNKSRENNICKSKDREDGLISVEKSRENDICKSKDKEGGLIYVDKSRENDICKSKDKEGGLIYVDQSISLPTAAENILESNSSEGVVVDRYSDCGVIHSLAKDVEAGVAIVTDSVAGNEKLLVRDDDYFQSHVVTYMNDYKGDKKNQEGSCNSAIECSVKNAESLGRGISSNTDFDQFSTSSSHSATLPDPVCCDIGTTYKNQDEYCAIPKQKAQSHGDGHYRCISTMSRYPKFDHIYPATNSPNAAHPGTGAQMQYMYRDEHFSGGDGNYSFRGNSNDDEGDLDGLLVLPYSLYNKKTDNYRKLNTSNLSYSNDDDVEENINSVAVVASPPQLKLLCEEKMTRMFLCDRCYSAHHPRHYDYNLALQVKSDSCFCSCINSNHNQFENELQGVASSGSSNARGGDGSFSFKGGKKQQLQQLLQQLNTSSKAAERMTDITYDCNFAKEGIINNNDDNTGPISSSGFHLTLKSSSDIKQSLLLVKPAFNLPPQSEKLLLQEPGSSNNSESNEITTGESSIGNSVSAMQVKVDDAIYNNNHSCDRNVTSFLGDKSVEINSISKAEFREADLLNLSPQHNHHQQDKLINYINNKDQSFNFQSPCSLHCSSKDGVHIRNLNDTTGIENIERGDGFKIIDPESKANAINIRNNSTTNDNYKNKHELIHDRYYPQEQHFYDKKQKDITDDDDDKIRAEKKADIIIIKKEEEGEEGSSSGCVINNKFHEEVHRQGDQSHKAVVEEERSVCLCEEERGGGGGGKGINSCEGCDTQQQLHERVCAGDTSNIGIGDGKVTEKTNGEGNCECHDCSNSGLSIKDCECCNYSSVVKSNGDIVEDTAINNSSTIISGGDELFNSSCVHANKKDAVLAAASPNNAAAAATKARILLDGSYTALTTPTTNSSKRYCDDYLENSSSTTSSDCSDKCVDSDQKHSSSYGDSVLCLSDGSVAVNNCRNCVTNIEASYLEGNYSHGEKCSRVYDRRNLDDNDDDSVEGDVKYNGDICISHEENKHCDNKKHLLFNTSVKSNHFNGEDCHEGSSYLNYNGLEKKESGVQQLQGKVIGVLLVQQKEGEKRGEIYSCSRCDVGNAVVKRSTRAVSDICNTASTAKKHENHDLVCNSIPTATTGTVVRHDEGNVIININKLQEFQGKIKAQGKRNNFVADGECDSDNIIISHDDLFDEGSFDDDGDDGDGKERIEIDTFLQVKSNYEIKCGDCHDNDDEKQYDDRRQPSLSNNQIKDNRLLKGDNSSITEDRLTVRFLNCTSGAETVSLDEKDGLGDKSGEEINSVILKDGDISESFVIDDTCDIVNGLVSVQSKEIDDGVSGDKIAIKEGKNRTFCGRDPVLSVNNKPGGGALFHHKTERETTQEDSAATVRTDTLAGFITDDKSSSNSLTGTSSFNTDHGNKIVDTGERGRIKNNGDHWEQEEGGGVVRGGEKTSGVIKKHCEKLSLWSTNEVCSENLYYNQRGEESDEILDSLHDIRSELLVGSKASLSGTLSPQNQSFTAHSSLLNLVQAASDSVTGAADYKKQIETADFSFMHGGDELSEVYEEINCSSALLRSGDSSKGRKTGVNDYRGTSFKAVGGTSNKKGFLSSLFFSKSKEVIDREDEDCDHKTVDKTLLSGDNTDDIVVINKNKIEIVVDVVDITPGDKPVLKRERSLSLKLKSFLGLERSDSKSSNEDVHSSISGNFDDSSPYDDSSDDSVLESSNNNNILNDRVRDSIDIENNNQHSPPPKSNTSSSFARKLSSFISKSFDLEEQNSGYYPDNEGDQDDEFVDIELSHGRNTDDPDETITTSQPQESDNHGIEDEKTSKDGEDTITASEERCKKDKRFESGWRCQRSIEESFMHVSTWFDEPGVRSCSKTETIYLHRFRSEEPAITNMDISTGHIVLSYMEDHLKNKGRLDQEWEGLVGYEAEPNSVTIASETANMRKNRYTDVLPYDHSRVVLNGEANVSGSDYINASTITDHDPRNPAYVASQGPLPHTVADFWQMVWEQGSVVIVNLTKQTEGGSAMCHRYWPEEGSDLYHIYEVHLVSEHIWCDDYLVRSFYLKNLQTNETRTVTQFHFQSWPDLGIPGSIKALLDFRRKVNKSYRGRSCPIVVHCSDGSGRSGTYTLIDMVLNRMSKGAKEIDIAATLEHIRDQRMQMVKTKHQFEFALASVAEEVTAILKALPQQQ